MDYALSIPLEFEAMDSPLFRWRTRYQVSQTALAKRCGVTQQAIALYEADERTPRGDTLAALVRETGLPLEALVFPEQFLQQHPDFLEEPPKPAPPKRPLRPRQPRRSRGEQG